MSDYELKPAWLYVSMSERMHECEQQTLRWRLVCGRSSMRVCGCVRVFSTLCKQTDRGRKQGEKMHSLKKSLLSWHASSFSPLQELAHFKQSCLFNIQTFSSSFKKERQNLIDIKVSNNFIESYFTQSYLYIVRGSCQKKKTLNWKSDTKGCCMCESKYCSGT